MGGLQMPLWNTYFTLGVNVAGLGFVELLGPVVNLLLNVMCVSVCLCLWVHTPQYVCRGIFVEVRGQL